MSVFNYIVRVQVYLAGRLYGLLRHHDGGDGKVQSEGLQHHSHVEN